MQKSKLKKMLKSFLLKTRKKRRLSSTKMLLCLSQTTKMKVWQPILEI